MHAIKAHGGSKCLAPTIFNHVTNQSQLSPSHSCHLNPGETVQVLIKKEAWWAPELVWHFGQEKSFALSQN